MNNLSVLNSSPLKPSPYSLMDIIYYREVDDADESKVYGQIHPAGEQIDSNKIQDNYDNSVRYCLDQRPQPTFFEMMF